MRWCALLAMVICSWTSVAQAEMMSVKVGKANFREGPSTSHDVLYTADRNYPVRIVRCDAEWCKTEDFEGDVAWVARRLLCKQPAVVVSVDHANVRRKPSPSAKVLYKAVRAEALRVVEHRGVWIEVKDVNGNEGWIHRSVVWGMVDSGGQTK